MIEIKQVTKCRPGEARPVLDGVSFKVRNRRICGILGPKGAGKSTIADIIAGVSAPTEGTVLINGYDIQKQPADAKKQIGYLAAPPALFDDMTPYEYLHFVAEIKGVRGELLDAQVKEAVALTGLTSVQDCLIKGITGGMKQWVGLAATLLGTPDVILLDEPMEGMSASQINEARRLLRRLAQTKTVIVTGCVLVDMMDLCDQIVILSEGRVMADGSLEELAAHEPPLEEVFAALTRRASEVPTVAYEDTKSADNPKADHDENDDGEEG